MNLNFAKEYEYVDNKTLTGYFDTCNYILLSNANIDMSIKGMLILQNALSIPMPF